MSQKKKLPPIQVDVNSYSPEKVKAILVGGTTPYKPYGTEGNETSGYRDYDVSQYEGLIGRNGGDGLMNIKPEDFQDTAAENQWWLTQMSKGVGRAVMGAGFKTVQGLGMAASALGVGAYEGIQAIRGEEGNEDVFGAITQNSFVNALFQGEENMKNSEALRIYKPEDWDERSIWQQIFSSHGSAWVSDELADGAAFMASSMIQAGMIGKLGIAARTTGLLSKTGLNTVDDILAATATQTTKSGAMGSSFLSKTLGKLTPKSVGNATEFLTTTAAMSANESLFEARDTGHQIQSKLLLGLGYKDADRMSIEEQKELIESLPEDKRQELYTKKGEAMSNTFMGNMSALMFSNAIELSAINKIMGKGFKNILGQKSRISGEGNVLSKLDDLSPTAKRFWNKGSATRAVGKSVGVNVLAEGFFEENIQNAIQNVSLNFDGEGNLEYAKDVFSTMFENTISGDKDTWKGIVTGAVLGGIGGATAGYKGWKDDKERRTKNIANINSARDNVVNVLGQLYKKNEDGTTELDEAGNPVYDENFLTNYIAKTTQMKDLVALQDAHREGGASEVADVIKSEIFSRLALSYVEAGLDSQLDARVANIEGLTDEQLTELGMPQEDNESNADRQKSIADAKVQFRQVAENVKSDYASFKRIIPEENQTALNQAVKTSARIRSLNDIKATKTDEVHNLKGSQGAYSVNEINARIIRIKELENSLKSISPEKNPMSHKAISAKIKKETESLTEYKEGVRESVWENNLVRVPEGLNFVRDGSVSVEWKAKLKNAIKKEAQLEIAAEEQLENLNSILTDHRKYTDKLADKLDEFASESEQRAESEEVARGLQPGDMVEITDEFGNVFSSQVNSNPSGRGLALEDGTPVTDIPSTYTKIRKLDAVESLEQKEEKRISFKNTQARRRALQISENINRIRQRYFNELNKVEKNSKKLDVLKNQLTRATTAISEAELNKEIEAIEDVIGESLEEATRLKELIDERYDMLSELQKEIAERTIDTSIESLEEQVAKTKESLEALEVNLNEEKSFLTDMLEIYNNFKDTWKRFFPNKTRDFRETPANVEDLLAEYVKIQNDLIEEPYNPSQPTSKKKRAIQKWNKTNNENKEWSEAKVELETRKEEILNRIGALKKVSKQKELLEKRLEFYEQELNNYRAFLNRQNSYGKLHPDDTQGGNSFPPPSNAESALSYGDGPRKDIAGGLFSTTGNFNRNTPQSNAWFKFTQSKTVKGDVNLAIVTIHDPVFGLGKEHDVFSHEPKEFQTENNVKIVAVRNLEKGQPVTPYLVNGEKASTSLIEPKDSYEEFTLQDGTPMFTNLLKLDKEQLDIFVAEYKDFIEQVKEESKSGNRRVVAIESKSIGFINKEKDVAGNPITPPAISAKDAFGYTPKVKVSNELESNIKGLNSSTELGAPYVFHESGNTIPAKVRNINEVEANALVEALKDYARGRMKAVGAVIKIPSQIQSILYLGESANSPQHSTFFVKGAETFVFGENVVSFEDLLAGKVDSALVEHLQNQRHQISNSLLNNKGEFVSIMGITYPDYNSYLVRGQGRDTADLPLTFEILPIKRGDNSSHQIGGMYISYSQEKVSDKVAPPLKSVSPPTSAPSANGIVLDIDSPSEMNAQAQANATKPSTKVEKEKALKKELAKDAKKEAGRPPADIFSDAIAEAMAQAQQEAMQPSTELGSAIPPPFSAVSTTSPTAPTVTPPVETPVETPAPTKVAETPAERRERLKAGGARPVGTAKGVTNVVPTVTPVVNIASTPEQEAQDSQDNDDLDNLLGGLKKVSKPEGLDIFEKKENLLPKKSNSRPKFLAKSVVENYKKGDIAEEVKFLEKVLGKNNLLTIVQGLIEGKDFGQVLPSGKVLLSSLMTRGTAYHEAFHVVFDFALSQAEQDIIYDEYRKANPKFENRSDIAVEEAIAEEFRDFAITKEDSGFLRSVFDRILELIQSALRLVTNKDAQTAKETLFKNMLNGKYQNKFSNNRMSGIKKMSAFSEDNVLANEFGIASQRAFFEGMTFDLLTQLRENGFNFEDLNSFQGNRISEEGAGNFESIFESLFWNNVLTASENNPDDGPVNLSLIPFIEENKDAILGDFKNYLKRFNLVTREDIEGQTAHEESDKSKDTLGITDAIEFDPKAGSPSIIKLALSSLPSYVRVNGIKVEEKNELGLPRMSDYRTNIATLFNELAGLETLEEMRAKLIAMSANRPEFTTLLDILSIPLEGDIRSTNLNESALMLQNKFRETFDKAHYVYNIQKYNEGGDSYLTDGSTDRIESVVREKWRGNFINISNHFKKFYNGYEVFNAEAYKAVYPILTVDNVIDFYKDLGIEFTYPNKVNTEKLLTEAPRILNRLENIPSNDLFSDELGIRGWVSSFIREEVNNSLNFADNQHITSDGKTVYSISLNNMLTIAARKINKGVADYLKWNSKNSTGNAYARNSVVLNRGWKVKVEVIEGANANQREISGEKTSKLSRTDTEVQQIVAMMNNQKSVVPFLRQADRGIEFALSFESNGNPVKFTDMKLDTLGIWEPIIQGYLADELLTSYMLNVQNEGADIIYYKDNAKDLRIFKGIFSTVEVETYKKIINNKNLNKVQAIRLIDSFVAEPRVKAALGKFMESKTERIFNELVKSQVVSQVGDLYINNLLPESILSKGAMSKEAMVEFLTPFSRAFFMSNVEQLKLFTGDPSFYKQKGNKLDFFKRTSGLGGTGRTLANDLNYLATMDEVSPRYDKPRSTKIKTWLFSDIVTTSSQYENYLKIFSEKFGEAKAKKMLEPYRRYDEADAQGYITIHAYKDMLERAGQWTDLQESIYRNKLVYGEPLSVEDVLSFPPLKPQYFGPQTTANLYVPTFLKLSLMPLIPSSLSNKQLDKLRVDMEDNGTDIATYLSGNKVGNNGQNDFYSADGKYNTGLKSSMELDWDFMKIQLDMSPETKKKVTFGTQFRKLILSNIIGKTLFGKDSAPSVDKYNKLIQKLSELEMKGLTDRLEVKFEGDTATLSIPKLTELLRSDAFRTNASKNVVDDINQILGNFSYTNGTYVEAMVTRGRMENLLMGMVNDGVIRNKMPGDMFVQGASSGFETKTRVRGDNEWMSDSETLKFYEYDDKGTKAMEVLLPHRFKEMFGKNVNLDNVDPRLLEIVGFRIPTQGLNSIEVIKIKGFLPKEVGNLVIVPSEIVAKAGSDFDIDKLTAFLNNYKINRNWKTVQSEFGKLDDNTVKSYLNIYGDNALRDLENQYNSEGLDSMGEVEKYVYGEYEKFLSGRPELEAQIEYEEYNENEPTIKGVQNEIIKMAREIVSAPENFVELISPISASILEEQAREIAALRKDDDSLVTFDRYIDFDYIQTTRENFLTGKEGVGITALHLVHHTMSQQVGLSLKSDPLIKEETTSLPSIKLPTNKTENGDIDFAGTLDVNNGNNILDTISAFLNGFVDIAKDPFMKTLNATSDTANIFLTLLRAGVPLKSVVRFLNQPIIADYVEALKVNNSISKAVTEQKLTNFEIKNLLIANYGSTFSVSEEEVTAFLQSNAQMEEAITKGNSDSESNAMQLAVLKEYIAYMAIASDLSNIMSTTNADTQGSGPSLYMAEDYIERYEEIKRTTKFNNVDKFETDTFLGGFNDIIRQTVKMYSPLYKVLKSPFAKAVLDSIKNDARANFGVSNDKLRSIMSMAENEIISYLVQNSVNEKGNKMSARILNLFKGPNSLPKRISQLKQQNPNLANNLLIKELTPILSKLRLDNGTVDAFDNMTIFSKRLPTEVANDLTSAWEELFTNKFSEIDTSKIAGDLFEFALIQSSLNRTTTEFLKYTPTRFTAEILNRFIELGLNSDIKENEFLDRFYRNNASNSDIVPVVKSRKGGYRASENLINEALSTLKVKSKPSGKSAPFVKTWHKEKGEKGKFYFRLWERNPLNPEDATELNYFESSPLNVGKIYKNYGNARAVLEEDLTVKAQLREMEAEDITRQPTSFEEMKVRLSSEIDKLDTTTTKKNLLKQILRKSKSEEQLNQVKKMMCNV